ncbi:hypothetical protein ACOI1C_14830 [Bacillus sp. DJP31]|uniref:hypothetical protein n=1 Tax=Bacillus sp. DJP31 TaxID=3409789 RepID=UPI003BB6A48C
MQIDLTTLADFEWDNVHVFGPYTTGQMIEDSTGIKFLFGGIDVMETQFLLVFAKGENRKKRFTFQDNMVIIKS